MNYGLRKPSVKKSIAGRTTSKIKRATNSTINPTYNKKGVGIINDTGKAVYNKVYNKTTVGLNDILNDVNENEEMQEENTQDNSGTVSAVAWIIVIAIMIWLFAKTWSFINSIVG